MIDFTHIQDHCLLNPGSTIREGLLALESGAIRIAFLVTDDDKLISLVTDGDMRRALLAGAQLDSRLIDFSRQDFLFVGPNAGRAAVLDLMQSRAIQHVPVVDTDQHLLGVHLLGELITKVTRTSAALFLAGGRGTRLWPLTEDTPKPMLRVAGRPILERLLLHVLSFGIRRIYFSVNYLARQIQDYFGDGSRFGCEITYLHEEISLGTGGPLRLITDILTDPLLVLNGDLVTQADLGSMLDFHSASKNAITVGVRTYQIQIPFGCLEVHHGRVVSLEEKPILCKQINTGIYAVEPVVLDLIPRGKLFPITDLIKAAMQDSYLVGAHEILDDWIDVGQKEHLAVAQEGSFQKD